MPSGVQENSERLVSVAQPRTLAISAFDRAELSATHVNWQDSGLEIATRCDRADGYVVYLLRRELPAHPYWVDERATSVPTIARGQFLLLDLRAQHSALVRGDVDCISLFTGSDALKRFREEHDLRPAGLLQVEHGIAQEDQAIHHLGEALMPAISQPHTADQLYVSHVALALLSRLVTRYGPDSPTLKVARGGLAPRQLRRAKDMLIANLDGRIGLEALAAECQLSRSHFARAFKASTGMSPIRWLYARRIECAKDQLLHTDFTVEQIAASCAFADASHLVRSFLQATGVTPGEWRRRRRL